MSTLEALTSTSLRLRKDRDPLAPTISSVLGAAKLIAKLERGRGGADFVVTDDDAIQAIRKALKQADDTLTILKNENRTADELYQHSQREKSILEGLLPAAISVDDIAQFIREYIAANNIDRTPKNTGVIMSALSEKYGAALDRRIAAGVIKEQLTA